MDGDGGGLERRLRSGRPRTERQRRPKHTGRPRPSYLPQRSSHRSGWSRSTGRQSTDRRHLRSRWARSRGRARRETASGCRGTTCRADVPAQSLVQDSTRASLRRRCRHLPRNDRATDACGDSRGAARGCRKPDGETGSRERQSGAAAGSGSRERQSGAAVGSGSRERQSGAATAKRPRDRFLDRHRIPTWGARSPHIGRQGSPEARLRRGNEDRLTRVMSRREELPCAQVHRTSSRRTPYWS